MQLGIIVSSVFSVIVLLAVKAQNSNGQDAFPRVDPNRLQFFRYEPVSVNCEEFDGPTEWRVMRKLKESALTNIWETSSSSHKIPSVYPAESGQYWCEDGEGKRSRAVNITVSTGDVILILPAAPLTEGHSVTLRCQKKETSNLRAQFYKNGFQINSSDTGEMTIHRVSKSDEGLYKCRVSGGGESPESWMIVKEFPAHHADRVPLWIPVSVLCLAQLLLVMGLMCCGKRPVNGNVTQIVNKRKDDTESEGSTFISPQERVLYSSVCYRSVKVETLH